MPPKLSNQDYQIRLKRGTATKLTSSEDTYGLQGEPFYATDIKQLYIHDGTIYEQIGLVRTSSSADPTTTEYPNDKDAGIHKNTTSGDVFLAYNDGGSTIVKVQLT